MAEAPRSGLVLVAAVAAVVAASVAFLADRSIDRTSSNAAAIAALQRHVSALEKANVLLRAASAQGRSQLSGAQQSIRDITRAPVNCAIVGYRYPTRVVISGLPFGTTSTVTAYPVFTTCKNPGVVAGTDAYRQHEWPAGARG